MVSTHVAPPNLRKLSLRPLATPDALYPFDDVDIWPTKRPGGIPALSRLQRIIPDFHDIGRIGPTNPIRNAR